MCHGALSVPAGLSGGGTVGMRPPVQCQAQMPVLPFLFLKKIEVVSVSSLMRVSPRLGHLGVGCGVPVVFTQLCTCGEGPEGAWPPV